MARPPDSGPPAEPGARAEAADAALAALGWTQAFAAQLTPAEQGALQPMRVCEVGRTQARALAADGVHALAYPRAGRWSEALTVGDWVLAERQHGQFYLRRVLARRNGIVRRAAGGTTVAQWLAANLDAVFVVLACDDTFSASRLERYLSVVRQSGIEPVIVLTKADLHAAPETLRASLPADCASTVLDARTAANDPVLARYVGPGCTVALLGTSGVGKSTLVNALAAAATQATQAVRAGDSRGRHTTTARHLLRLPSGACIIDTPGIRELALPGADGDAGESPGEGTAAFADIAALARDCRFADCGHGAEPGCAVRAAVTAGALDARRAANFRKLHQERGDAERLAVELQRRQRGARARGRAPPSARPAAGRGERAKRRADPGDPDDADGDAEPRDEA